MKFYFNIILLIFFGSVKSQGYNIVFSHIDENSDKSFEYLSCDPNKSCSIQDSIIDPYLKKSMFDQNSNTVVVKNKDKVYRKIYFRKNKLDLVEIIEYIGDRKFFVRDSLPKINWKISSIETKTICGYICKKASATFRGSEIVAYYTTQIPISSGPFKFSGLPGTILEIFENGKNINIWKAESVKKISEIKCSNMKDNNSISMAEFVAIKQDSMIAKFKKMTANVPKDAISNFHFIRNGIEKKYEWEK